VVQSLIQSVDANFNHRCPENLNKNPCSCCWEGVDRTYLFTVSNGSLLVADVVQSQTVDQERSARRLKSLPTFAVNNNSSSQRKQTATVNRRDDQRISLSPSDTDCILTYSVYPYTLQKPATRIDSFSVASTLTQTNKN